MWGRSPSDVFRFPHLTSTRVATSRRSGLRPTFVPTWVLSKCGISCPSLTEVTVSPVTPLLEGPLPYKRFQAELSIESPRFLTVQRSTPFVPLFSFDFPVPLESSLLYKIKTRFYLDRRHEKSRRSDVEGRETTGVTS